MFFYQFFKGKLSVSIFCRDFLSFSWTTLPLPNGVYFRKTEFEKVFFFPLRVDTNLDGYDVQGSKQDVEKIGCLSKNTSTH